MHLCEQNNGPVSVQGLRGDSLGFMAAANGANLISGVHTLHLRCGG
jgi:hypothetical protein